jgi:hypothetical protein
LPKNRRYSQREEILPKFKNRQEYEIWKASNSGEKEDNFLHKSPDSKPLLVTAIGWGFIVFAFLMILGSLSGLAQSAIFDDFFTLFNNFDKAETSPQNMPLFFQIMMFSMRHMMVLAILLLCLAVSVLVASIFFLRLKRWARTFLEVFSWIALGLICIMGILFTSLWFGGPAFFSMFGVLVSLFITLSFAAIPGAAVFALRNETVKNSFP